MAESRITIKIDTRVSANSKAGKVREVYEKEFRSILLGALQFYYATALAREGAPISEVEVAITHAQERLNLLADEARSLADITEERVMSIAQATLEPSMTTTQVDWNEEDGF